MEAIVNGLIQTIVHNDTEGYEIFNYVCKKCKQEVSFKKEEIVNKCKCGGGLKYVSTIDKETVQEIVSRQPNYTCPRCKKEYDTAVDCCIAKEQRIKRIAAEYGAPDRWVRGIYV
jgi:DNA-directed RNA polymerase subunit RPC12/RpoP